IPQKHVLMTCGCGNRPQGGWGEARRTNSGASIAPIRESTMAVSLASRPTPVPTGSEAMSLKFEIQPAANPVSEKDRAAKLVEPGFGRVFTDHMAIVRYTQGRGWHDARVESRANFPLDPAMAVLHYAQEIFEGLKAYKR